MESVKAKSITGDTLELPRQAIDELQNNFRGNIILESDPEYNECRTVWNGMINKKPFIIARCSGTADVMEAVKFARKHNLMISIRSGGHHVAGKSVCDDGIVIDLSDMRGVHVYPKTKTATVQGGATLGDIDHETFPFGLSAPLGVVSETGVAGLSLHGGYGWRSRKHGLALDNIRAAEVVTADGNLIRASKDENPDLYWGLRGGGGNFGIVTTFEFELHPIEKQSWLLMTFYPMDVAKKGMELFRERMPNAPEELGMIAVFWTAPNEEFIPEQWRGKPAFVLLGSYVGDLNKGEKELAPFRNLGTPIADLSAPMPFKDIQKVLDADFPGGRNYYWKSAYIDELSSSTIDMIIEKAGKRPSPLTSLDIWALGGKVSRVKKDETPFFRRDAKFLVNMESNWDDPDANDENVGWARDVFDDLVKRQDTSTYLNFPGFGEEGDDFLKKSFGPNYKRLKEVKAKYDPDNFFQGFIRL